MSNSASTEKDPAARSAVAASASHTPGPWSVGTFVDEPGVIPCRSLGLWADRGRRHIALLMFGEVNSENEANSRLIAAAPDLLAFAESVVTLFAEAYPKAGLHLDMDKASVLNAAREVIKKARGQ